MMRKLFILGGLATGLAAVYACVGDATNPSLISGDAGVDAPTGDGAIATDSSPPLLDGDALTDAGPKPCDISAPFTSSAYLKNVSTSDTDTALSLTPDELNVFSESHISADSGLIGTTRVFQGTRASTGADFSGLAPVELELQDGGDLDPWIQPDDTTLYFASTRGNFYRVYITKRTTPAAAFAAPSTVVNIAVEGGAVYVRHPSVSADGTEMFFATQSPDLIYHSVATNMVFGAPTPVMEINTLSGGTPVTSPVLGYDALVLYFTIETSGASAVWVAERADRKSPFGNAHAVTEINEYTSQSPLWLSPDQCRLYVSQQRDDSGDQDFYVYSREP